MYPTITFLTALLATSITVTSFVITDSPPLDKPQPHLLARDSSSSTPPAPNPLSQLLTIIPTATSCSDATFPSECATASQALSPILSSFNKYSILTAPEQAALLSWMAFESAEFKFNINHFPGTPGQGTRCMLSPTFVKQYASSIPSISSQLAGKSPSEILGLVEGDTLSFASAAWFYSSQCSEGVKLGVRSGSRAGWVAFVSGCVGTTVDEGAGSTSREAYWRRAMAALSVTIS